MNTLQAKLEATDWQAYERRIVTLTSDGLDAFTAAAGNVKIYQVSIWTDLEARVSAINFETSVHAREYAEGYAQRLRSDKLHAQADEVLRVSRSANPANFFFRDAAECYHPELEPLRRHIYSKVKFAFADTYLAGRLLLARKAVLASGVLSTVPHEDPIWFGISSQESWYDYEEAFHI